MFSKRNPRSQNEVSLDILSEVSNSFRASAQGNVNELKEFVSMAQTKSVLMEVDENGASLLHAAAAHNQLSVMRYLLDCGVDRDAMDKDGNTPLHLATIHGSMEAVHLLLDCGASDTILNESLDSPLHIAVRVNDSKVVETFIHHPHVDIFQPGRGMNTPAHIAAMHNSVESFKVLCESTQMKEAVRGKDKYKLSSKNSSGQTALHVASSSGSHQILELIIHTYQLLGCSTGVEMVQELCTGESDAPLYLAVKAGHTEVVRILMKYGAVPTKACGSKVPPLHLACAQGKLEMLQPMVKHFGKDILTHRDQFGRPPVHYSVIPFHSARIIAFLSANGVDLDAPEEDGDSPLHMAIKCGNLSSVKELLNGRANPLVKNNEGKIQLTLLSSLIERRLWTFLVPTHWFLNCSQTKIVKDIQPSH